MIGRRRKLGVLTDHLHRLIAVHLRHHDVHQHDRHVRRRFQRCAIASLPVVAVSTFMPRRSSTLRQREDVAHVVVDQQHRAADQILVGAVQPLEHALLLRRQIGRPTRCRNSAVSSSRRSGDSTPLTTTLRAMVCSCASSSGDSSRPVKTTTGTSARLVVVAQSAPAPRSRTCRAAADRARRSRSGCSRSIAQAPRRRCRP